jgi:hypothetical protein
MPARAFGLQQDHRAEEDCASAEDDVKGADDAHESSLPSIPGVAEARRALAESSGEQWTSCRFFPRETLYLDPHNRGNVT